MKASKTLTIDPRIAKAAVARHMQRLGAAVNMTQVSAQAHEVRMVGILAEMAENDTLPSALRMQAAVHVITFARGSPKVWRHDGETVNPDAEGASGLGNVGQEIEAARNTAKLHNQLNLLVSSNTHPRDWPESVREIAADMVKYYENDDATR